MRRYLVPTVVFVVVTSLLGVSAAVGAAGGGQVTGDGVRFSNDMAGAEEVPPTDLDSRGRVKLSFDTSTGEVCFNVRFSGTGTPNRAHIHTGAAGVNGGIIVPLFELVGQPDDPRNDDVEDRRLSDCVTVDPALLRTIASDPTSYYVNLHNARYPGGSMRCQLVDP